MLLLLFFTVVIIMAGVVLMGLQYQTTEYQTRLDGKNPGWRHETFDGEKQTIDQHGHKTKPGRQR